MHRGVRAAMTDMTELAPDPLLERLRALDPAARDGAVRLPTREQVARAHRRRVARRARRLSAAGALTALLAVVGLNLAPSGGPNDRGLLARAAQAATLPARSIVVIESELTLTSRFEPHAHA